MCLHVDSDAAYLVMPGARSRFAGYYHLSSRSSTALLNGAILVECKTIRHVMSSAAEAETAGLFNNAQTAIMIRNALVELGHQQPPTPIKTDNTTANSFVHANMRQRKSKSWDMRYHWLRDRSLQRQFHIFWDKGIHNNADYFTKHHSPQHHQLMRQRYFHLCNFMSCSKLKLDSLTRQVSSLTMHVRGCVSAPPFQGYQFHTHVR